MGEKLSFLLGIFQHHVARAGGGDCAAYSFGVKFVSDFGGFCVGVGEKGHGDSPVWVCNVCVNVRRDASAVLLPMNPVSHGLLKKSREIGKLLIYKGELG
jgi:hypothetical protein